MGQWLEGKILADKIKEEVGRKVARYQARINQVPGLIGVLVGDNPSSQVYLRSKQKNCTALGIFSQILSFPKEMEADSLKAEIEKLNRREDVDGILVQLPLPTHLNPYEIISIIRPDKDVDGFHPYNLGSLLLNQRVLGACTPQGVLELLKFRGIPIEGSEVVIIGRSMIVGKPLAAMMINENATVTICHSKTAGLDRVASRADILVAAMGRPAFVTREFVKPGAAVIDVGINNLTDKEKAREYFGDDPRRQKDFEDKGYTLIGDVDPRVIDRAAYLTPVPGGVGLLTVAMLMKNTLEAFEKRRGLSDAPDRSPHD